METEKDDIIECVADDMGVYGEGITHVGGQTVFIPGAIRGEKVRARIVLAKPTFAHAVLTKIIAPSENRTEPPCPYFKQCGGCELQHVAYKEQLALKRDIVRNAFKKYAGLDIEVFPTVPSDKIYGYRNKLSLPVRSDNKRGTAFGLFMKRSHRVVEIGDCLLQKPRMFKAAKRAVDFALECGLKGYDETGGGGDLRHVTVRSLESELSLCYVLGGERKKFEKRLKERLDELRPENFSLFVNINTSKNNVILGGETRLLYGDTRVSVGGNITDTHPQAFFQVNDGVRDNLYGAVENEIDSDAAVIDAYCGAGIMSALVAKKAKKVVGIEISRAAIDSAERLKESGGLNNLSFVCGDCAKEINRVLSAVKDGRTPINVILDPPKSGCADGVLDSLINSRNVEKIIYVSCNPATLARDCARLMGSFSVSSVTPFDMFPQTTSVETLAVLSQKIPAGI